MRVALGDDLIEDLLHAIGRRPLQQMRSAGPERHMVVDAVDSVLLTGRRMEVLLHLLGGALVGKNDGHFFRERQTASGHQLRTFEPECRRGRRCGPRIDLADDVPLLGDGPAYETPGFCAGNSLVAVPDGCVAFATQAQLPDHAVAGQINPFLGERPPYLVDAPGIGAVAK